MKIILLIIVFFAGFSGIAQAQTDYEKDEQYFYVNDALNNALDFTNAVICHVSSMRPDAFVNDGNYLSTFSHSFQCDNQIDDSDGETSSAPTKSEAVEKQVTVGAGAEDKSDTEKLMLKSLMKVTRKSAADPVISHAWIHHDDPEIHSKIYARIQQAAGISDIAPHGEFEMHWTALSNKTVYHDEGNLLGWGYLAAKDSTVNMIEHVLYRREQFTATTLENGDIEGVFTDSTDNYGDGRPFNQAFYKFYISDKDKSYCRQLLAVEEVTPKYKGDNYKADKNDLYIVGTVETVAEDQYEGLGISSDEHCFSTERNKATRNIFEYGVYNQDGSRLDIGLTHLKVQAEVINKNGDRVDIHAYGSRDHVWVFDGHDHLVDKDTVFKQRLSYGEDAKDDKTYRLRPKQLSVTKYETVKQSLNSLDNMPFEIYEWHVKRFLPSSDTLGDDSSSYVYIGVYNAENQKITLAPKKLWYSKNDENQQNKTVEESESSYELTVSQMAGEMNDGGDSITIHLLDSGQSYKVTKAALEYPSDEEAVIAKISSPISFAEMEKMGDLYCVDDCVTAKLVKKTFDEVKQHLAKADKDNNKSNQEEQGEQGEQGEEAEKQWKEVSAPYLDLEKEYSVELDKLPRYKFDGNKLYETGDSKNQLFKEDLLSEFLNPNESYQKQLEGIRYGEYSSPIARGLDAGILVDKDNLEQLKCNGTRYCLNNLWGDLDKIDTHYVVKFHTRPRFEFLTETGEPVEFAPSKTLFYTVPKGDRATKHIGKKFTLRYNGHGDLSGIPFDVYDPVSVKKTWVDRFVIPDGGTLEDDAGNKFKVKALLGADWLEYTDKFEGKYSYSFNKDNYKQKLPSSDLLYIEDGKDAVDVIGPKPTDDIINDGKPSVIDGEVIFDPTPNAE